MIFKLRILNFRKKFLEEVLNTIIVKVVSEMQRFVYFHAQFSPWVDLGRRALLALAKEKKTCKTCMVDICCANLVGF